MIMRFFRAVPILPATVFISVLLLTMCSRKNSYMVSDGPGALPDQESWDFTFTISRAGMKSAEIQAGYLVKYENDGLTYLGQGMQVDYYDKKGLHVSTLTSDSGIINEKKEHLTALGNVIMVSDSGYTMMTDTVFWQNDSNIVYTENDITLYSEVDTLYGTGFTSDVKLENWTIHQPRGKSYREIRD